MANDKKPKRRSRRSSTRAKRAVPDHKKDDRARPIPRQNLDATGSPTGRARRLQKIVRDLKAKNDAARRETDKLRVGQESATAQFVSIEVDLALTFCEMASSSRDDENALRRIDRAMEAYESAAHFLKRIENSAAIKDAIGEKLQELKHAIERCRQARSIGRHLVIS